MGDHHRSSRGFVLIIVLAILSILALLGTTFVSLQSVERDISRNYLDATRANFTASSGIEYALVQLKQVLNSSSGPFVTTPLARSMVYFGDQMNESLSPNLSTPLRNAKNPSFAIEENGSDITDDPAGIAAYNPAPKLVRIDGNDVGYSGALEAGTYGRECDIYSVKITDANGKISVNDGLGHPADAARLKRILNNLGALSTVGVSGLGDLIIDNRPSNGYLSHHDLRRLFSDTAAFERVRNFVTVYAWVDNKVANPVPLSPNVLADYPVQYTRPDVAAGSAKPPSYPASWGNKIYRYGRQVNFNNQANTTPLTWGSNIYGWDELNPQYIEVTSRAPVNINVASREVLIALLQDIEGFFVMETPRDPLTYAYQQYLSNFHTWDDTTTPRSPYGFLPQPSMIGTLYRTVKVRGPSEIMGGEPSAEIIADKIIANRTRRLGTSDITQPYHGPFTSWAQFNLFLDSMVADGTIADTRFTGLQRTYASQAMADALKSNFNPNLHLNEINPDENLHALVDKTDLLFNTTEFCFAYRGIFEIESSGRILKPIGSGTSTEYRTVADKTIQCVVKLYDVVREGTQSDFYKGELTIDGGVAGTLVDAEAHTAYRTNNNRSLETGPEPDNGLAPSENEYEGYVRLSTVGGDLPVGAGSSSPVAGAVHKTKGHVWETPQGGPSFGANMHAHFSFDFDAHYAIAANAPVEDIRRRCLTRNWNRGTSIPGIAQTFYNYADWSEKNADGSERVVGPYSVSESPGITPWAADTTGLREYRIARSFRAAIGVAGTVTGQFFAPSDLRLDGAYSERHSAPVWWPGSVGTYQSNANSNIYTRYGAASVWIKPGFYPELGGKLRAFFSQAKLGYRADRDHLTCSGWCFHTNGWTINQFQPMAMTSFFVPNNATGIDNSLMSGVDASHRMPAQRSLAYGFTYSTWTGLTGSEGFWQQGAFTNTVNHVGHGDNTVINNKMMAHRWTHMTVRWNASRAQSILVNGQEWGAKVNVNFPVTPLSVPTAQDWNRQGRGAVWNSLNPVRLGEPSVLVPPGMAGTPGGTNANLNVRFQNFAADSTMDELYVWTDADNTTSANHAREQWSYGRYYRHGDGRFTSGDISIVNPALSRNLPNAAGEEIAPPTGTSTRARIIGVAWTQYAENYGLGSASNPLRYRLYDYQPWNTNASANPTELAEPRFEVKVSGDGGATWGPVVADNRWNSLNVSISEPARLKYSVKFVTNTSVLNSVLLASPVLDDVLLFVETGEAMFLEYVVM